jgi:hypothetical protein
VADPWLPTLFCINPDFLLHAVALCVGTLGVMRGRMLSPQGGSQMGDFLACQSATG